LGVIKNYPDIFSDTSLGQGLTHLLMSTGSIPRLNPVFVVTLGLCNLVSRIIVVALLALFHLSGDHVWFGFTCTIVCLSTFLDILVALSDHTAGVMAGLWTVLSILQLKPWADTFSFFVSPMLRDRFTPENHDTLKDHRVKVFLSTTTHSLPTSFLICYITMLELGGRINENYLLFALIFSVLSFSLGTTMFVAGDDPTPCAASIVFVHVLAQFSFRVIAVALICVKFEKWGVLAAAVSWFIVYLFGPQGSFAAWANMITCKNEDNHMCVPCLKILLTPLSFFVIIRPAYARTPRDQPQPSSDQQPGGLAATDSMRSVIPPEDDHKPTMVHHCFKDTQFIWFRLLENLIMVICFMTVDQEDERDYESWLHTPNLVIAASVVSILLTGATWLWVTKQRVFDDDN